MHTLPQNTQQRRQELIVAESWLVSAEALPKVVLALLLFVLPFFVSDTPFTDWTAFLWWIKGWTPVWVGVLALLYFSVGLVIAPKQLIGASIEAIAQTYDEQELVSSPQPDEMPCPFTLPVTESDSREVKAVTQTLWQQIRYRMTKIPQHPFPTLRFIPPAFSRDSLA